MRELFQAINLNEQQLFELDASPLIYKCSSDKRGEGMPCFSGYDPVFDENQNLPISHYFAFISVLTKSHWVQCLQRIQPQ